MIINCINSLHNMVLIKLIIPCLYVRKNDFACTHKLLTKIGNKIIGINIL